MFQYIIFIIISYETFFVNGFPFEGNGGNSSTYPPYVITKEEIDHIIDNDEIGPPLNDDDLEHGKKLLEGSIKFTGPFPENGSRYNASEHQGDILMTVEQYESLLRDRKKEEQEGRRVKRAIQPDHDDLSLCKLTIPYTLSSNFSADQHGLIRNAIEEYYKNTCIRLVERTDEDNYINPEKESTECSAFVRTIGDKQIKITLSARCFYKG